MKRIPLKIIAAIVNGEIIHGTDNLVISDIVTGTKRLTRGSLLFDLNRCKDYPDLRQKKGPFVIVTDRPAKFSGLNPNITIVSVAEISEAYWKFVDYYRNSFNIPVIGVTGTCGKTTTKEMIKHILAGSSKVCATYKSNNALFRNLRYLLEIDDHTQAAVFEMGVAFPGDLKISCRYFKPQVGVITNIGIDHLQEFKTMEAYISAKAELLEGLGYTGTLILNGDDPNIQTIDLSKFKGKIIYFGSGDGADFKIVTITPEKGVVKFILQHQDRTYSIVIPGNGEFNVYNATAAIAAVYAIGWNIEKAGARLASFQNIERHFEFKEGINGSTIIDDTWSTNPTSVIAALKLLKSLSQGKKTIAVLGKMSLLGEQSAEYHYQTGKQAAAVGIDQLIVIGNEAAGFGLGAIKNGMRPENVIFCKDSVDTYEILKNALCKNSIALVKTSMLTSYRDLMAKLVKRF